MSGGFAAYGPSHWAALGLFAIGCVGLIMLGRGQTPSEAKGFSRAFSLAIAYVVIGVQTYTLLPGHWSLGGSLPLQLCDLAWIVAIPTLWTRNRRWFALAYYWGLTLSVQALLTPALNGSDYPDIDYLNFFGPHLMIVWTAVYLTWGLGMRPDWGSYRFAVAVTSTWAVATFVFNWIAGTNYGFLNRKPSTGSALDLLGPWPWYVLAEVGIILAGWALITWPWTRGARGMDDAVTP
ncbi:YwaF family protein [Actinomadura barringtoniae]|uniref:YwaF family protein n=1 Tax=Actinomadura barringtoniae TaxID=1427535 RepID=UPI001FB81B05|nr:TIGR02206 family membrane protein [Actinomadura barringtoniae]